MTGRLTLSVLLFCFGLMAQDFRATITGRVTDTSGAVIPEAKIVATNIETGATASTVSTESGDYTIPALPPGPYKLEAEVTGFKRYVRQGITLEVQSRPQIDMTLEPGDVATSVSVTAEAPLLETSSASRGGVISGRTLVDLPLNGRNAFALAGLEPGVNFTARGQASTFLRTTANNGFSSFSFSGGQLRSNESLLDGVPNTGTDGLVQYVPSVDATQEFKVQTNSFDAEYGRFTGGVINAAIRSGTNELHGTLFHFVRNSYWNARDPFARNIPQFGYNLFGGSAGGPVRIPKVYDGKNRTFWFFNYEGSREGVPRANVSTVPTELQRIGDFSQTFVRSGGRLVPVNIHDPLTTRQQGSTYVRDQFPGNRIPVSRMDPIARRLMELYPTPNSPGEEGTGANNYLLSFKDPVSDNGYVFKVDHRFSDRYAMFARYSWRRFSVGRQGAFMNEVTGDSEKRDAPGVAFDNTITLNPTTVLNLRYGLSRFTIQAQSDNFGTDMTALGFPPSFVNQLTVSAIPAITVSNGYTTLSGANKLNRAAEDSHTLKGSLIKVLGRNTIRTGVEFRLLNSNIGSLGNAAAGSFSFDQGFTRGPNPQIAAVNSGFGLASFLLGYAQSGSVANNAATADRTSYWGFYIQDDIRFSSKLTLNVGLRYEFEGPYTERYNRLNRGFDFRAASPIEDAVRANYNANPLPEVPASQFDVKGGLLFAGVNGVPTSLSDLDTNNISPRIGIAYQFAPSTVFRAGYGIFYGASTQTAESRNGFSVSTPFVGSIDGGLTPANTLSDPFPQPLQQPSGAEGGLMTLAGQGIGFTSIDRRQPMAHQYSFGLQRQLRWSTVLEATYVGSIGNDLPVSRQLNAIPEEFRAAAERTFLETGRNTLTEPVTNPFFGVIASGPLAGRTVSRGQLLRPYPQFTSITGNSLPLGSSRYDSLQLKATKRFSAGFSFTASYAFSKQLERTDYLNDQDTELARQLSEFDIPQRLVLSTAYELPFGPGRALLSTSSGFLARLVEGFQVNVLYQAQSGIPISVSGAESIGRSAEIDNSTVNEWFDTSAFRLRQPLELVRTSRLPDVRSAGKNNFDLSLFKTTQLTETVRLQFRAEAFNALNRPEWSSPNGAFGNANFGRVTSANTFARQLQFALKLIF